MIVFVIEAIVLCVLFHLAIWLQARKDPAVKIYDYPPARPDRQYVHAAPLYFLPATSV